MTINEASAQTPAAAPAAVPAFAGNHQVKPLRFNPARLHGLSERLITSHHENNYAGSVKALNEGIAWKVRQTTLRENSARTAV